jgi:hypothetical protein
LSPGSSSRINRGSSLGQNPEPSASHQGDTGRTVSPGSLSRSGGVRTYPGSASRSSSSVGSYSPSPRVSAPNQSSGSGRQVTPRRYSPDASVSRYGTTSSGSRSSSGIQREPRNSSASQSGGQAPGSRSSVRSYSPSPRVSAPEQKSSSGRQGTPRRYTPNASISRYGTSLGSSYPGSTLREPGSSSGRRAQEWKPSDLGRSQSSTYRPSPWPPDPYPATRRDYSVGGGSASSPRSVFSAPRGSSSPRSSGYSAPSSFRSAPSFSSGSRSGGSASSGSRSGPSRSSSPSHGSSGRVSRRGG